MSNKNSGKLAEPNCISADEGQYKTLKFERVQANCPSYVGQPDKRFLITDSFFTFIMGRIEGIILTIIDSSTEDKEKREATKSLARRMIWHEAGDVRLLGLEKIK